MGNRPLKPVVDPVKVTQLGDAETASVLQARFSELAASTPGDAQSFTLGDLMKLDPRFTSKWGEVVVKRLFDVMDTEGRGKAASREGFMAAAFAASCGDEPERVKLLFNLFDASHKGEITEADFCTVFAALCEAAPEPARATPDPSTAAESEAAAASKAAVEDMMGAFKDLAGVGIHKYFDRSGSGTLTFDEFYSLVAHDSRFESLRTELSALLAPGLLG